MKQFILPFILIIGFQATGQNLDSLYDESVQALKQENYDSVKINSLELLKAARSVNDPYYLVRANFFLAYIHDEQENYGEAVIYYLEGSRIARKHKSNIKIQENLISMYKNLGNILGDLKHYDLAYKVIDEAITISLEIDNKDQTVSLLENKIHELVDHEKYLDALNLIKSIYETYPQKMYNLPSLKNKEGLVYKNMGKLENAKSCFDQNINTLGNHENYFAMALHNKASIFLLEGDSSRGKEYYQRSIDSKLNSGQINNNLISSYLELAKIYFAEQNFTKSITLLKKAESIDGAYSLPENHEIYDQLSKVYEKTGDHEKAEKYKEIFQKKKLAGQQSIELLTKRHFDLLNAHFEKEKSQKLAYWTTAAAIAFLLISFIVFIKYYKSRAVVKKEVNRIIRNFST